MEFLSAFNQDGDLIGKIERGEAHSKNAGVYHRAVWIWFYNSKGEILVQQRANKLTSPYKWDFVGGHVDFNEDLPSTCVRETQEELGITLPKGKFEFLFTTLNQNGWEFGETFIAEINTPIAEMKIDHQEVLQIKMVVFPRI